MKLSMETYVLRERFDDFCAIGMIRDAGFDALDYSFYWGRGSKDVLGDDYRERAAALRAALDAANITCNQTHAPIEMQPDDTFDEENPHFLRLVRSLEASAILGAEHVIVHRAPAPDGIDVLAHNRVFYRSLAPYCKKFGIRVAVENLFSVNGGVYTGIFAKPEILENYVRELGTDCFTACVDLGHASITGTEPQDFIAGMSGEILGALHVHDNDYASDCHWLPYSGSIQWKAVTDALAKIVYRGDLTLEVFGSLKKLPNALIPDALAYAAKIGRQLISQIEAAK